MTSSSEPIPAFKMPTNQELLEDNARKFIVKSFDNSILEEGATKSYSLETDWLEMDDATEKKLAYKKYSNGAIDILLISKATGPNGRVSQKEKITDEEYNRLLPGSVRRLVKVRHEFTHIQGDIRFEMKYDIFEGSKLQILEVDAKTDAERNGFNNNTFPGKIVEVTGDLRYYGYRIFDMLNDKTNSGFGNAS